MEEGGGGDGRAVIHRPGATRGGRAPPPAGRWLRRGQHRARAPCGPETPGTRGRGGAGRARRAGQAELPLTAAGPWCGCGTAPAAVSASAIQEAPVLGLCVPLSPSPAPIILLSTAGCSSSVEGARSRHSVQGCGELHVEPSNHRRWKTPLTSPAINPVVLL